MSVSLAGVDEGGRDTGIGSSCDGVVLDDLGTGLMNYDYDELRNTPIEAFWRIVLDG